MVEKRWTIYSWAIILFLFLFLLLRWPLLPNFLDIYYHLNVGEGFAKAGGFVSHDFWSYAPQGRPHLYPPLFHLLILILIKAGLPVLCIARLLDLITLPLFLAVIWFFMRSLFNARLAFFTVLLSGSLYSFYLASSNFMPVTFAFILGLLSLWAAERNKILSASLFLALSFYTHAQIPWFLLSVYLLYALFNRPNLIKSLKITFSAVLLSLPMLIYLFANQKFYNPRLVYEDFVWEVNLCLALAIPALPLIFKQKGRYYILLSLALAVFFFVFSYPYRYISGQGMLGLILLSAVGLERIYAAAENSIKQKKLFFAFFILALVLVFLSSPALLFKRGQPARLSIFNSTYVNLAYLAKTADRPNDYSLASSKYIAELVRIVQQNSQNQDTIFTNFRFIGVMLAALTDRADTTGTLIETAPLVQASPIANARLIIWFKDPDGRPELKLPELVSRYKLQLLAETEIAHVYRNNFTQAKEIIPKADISNMTILLIFLLIMGALTWDLKYEGSHKS